MHILLFPTGRFTMKTVANRGTAPMLPPGNRTIMEKGIVLITILFARSCKDSLGGTCSQANFFKMVRDGS